MGIEVSEKGVEIVLVWIFLTPLPACQHGDSPPNRGLRTPVGGVELPQDGKGRAEGFHELRRLPVPPLAVVPQPPAQWSEGAQ